MQTHESSINQYLTFMLSDEEYGIHILKVQEIKGWETATPLPNTPDYMLGVINLRGAIVPVMDMRKRFHIQSAASLASSVIIFIHHQTSTAQRTVGIAVDAVSDVYQVEPAAIKAKPEFGVAVNTDFIEGLIPIDQKMVILLDIAALIEDEIQ